MILYVFIKSSRVTVSQLCHSIVRCFIYLRFKNSLFFFNIWKHEFDSCLFDLKFDGSCLIFFIYNRLISNTELASLTRWTKLVLKILSYGTLPGKLLQGSAIALKRVYFSTYACINLSVRHILGKYSVKTKNVKKHQGLKSTS